VVVIEDLAARPGGRTVRFADAGVACTPDEAAVTGTTRPAPGRHSNVCSSNELRRHALSKCGRLDFTGQLSFFTTLLLIGSQ